MYFRFEADAREGERKEVPAELPANMEEMNKLSIGQPEFLISSNRSSSRQSGADHARPSVSTHLRTLATGLCNLR
jgi:hypothetical protein